MTGVQKDRLAPVALGGRVGDAGSCGEEGWVEGLPPGRTTQVDSGQGSRAEDGDPSGHHQHDQHHHQAGPTSGTASPSGRRARGTLRVLHADGSFMIRCDRALRLSVGLSYAMHRRTTERGGQTVDGSEISRSIRTRGFPGRGGSAGGPPHSRAACCHQARRDCYAPSP